MGDWNTKIIEEFRENKGKVGGPFAGARMLLLHTKGRKSGQPRVNPLVWYPEGDNAAIIASKGGAPTHPEWYRNLMANPDVSVEIGTYTSDVHARETEGEERERIFDAVKKAMPGFAEYEKRTDRVIPVIVLEKR
jgi:deazaflavin-dependent oxidoreductase (nitroreductase family)